MDSVLDRNSLGFAGCRAYARIVNEHSEADSGWQPVDYDETWAPVNERLNFWPDFHERTSPAIVLPDDSLVIDLAPVFKDEGPRFAAGEAAVNASALRSFVYLAGDGLLTALDWQHTPYVYSPAQHAVSGPAFWPVPVFPNGDYYFHVAADFEWGTFGHPWQQSLTIWGSALVASLGSELLAWLPRHPHSKA